MEADVVEAITAKIKVLNETVWEGRVTQSAINEWLNNFEQDPVEQLQALFLLSNFMYFGNREMRELIRAMFRDLYQYPIIEEIRRANGDTVDTAVIEPRLEGELRATRFFGVGNPSESGCHLLYYFRQENRLPKDLFIHTHQIFDRDRATNTTTLRFPDVRRYVFIDDFCGSGIQGTQYSTDILDDLKALKPNVSAEYYVLFGTEDGLNEVRSRTRFDTVKCIYELDVSFRCFAAESRYFQGAPVGVSKDAARAVSTKYGNRLWPSHPLGYGNCQLLIGFHHNTPDNTLPMIWWDESQGCPWIPIFRRYPKVYGWQFP